MRIQAGKILAVLIVLSSLAVASSYLMTGLLGVEEIENITVDIDYFNHWNATATSQGKTIAWSGFGKNVKSILGIVGEGGYIELRVQKDASNNALFVKVYQGDKELYRSMTAEPNGIVELNFVITRDTN